MRVSLLRQKVVSATLGRGKTALGTDIQAGLMTPPVPIGDRAVAWPSHEVDAVVAARIAELPNDEIRGLVKRLVADRQRFSSECELKGVGAA